jgi:hypothetical protein
MLQVIQLRGSGLCPLSLPQREGKTAWAKHELGQLSQRTEYSTQQKSEHVTLRPPSFLSGLSLTLAYPYLASPTVLPSLTLHT